MSNNQGSLRKSKRQHVPNPMYFQSISELKKESTVKPKRKGKTNDIEYHSYEEEQASLENIYNSKNDSHQRWLPCIFEDGTKMKVQIIPPVKELEEEKKKETKTVKKPVSNLLSIFQQVIEDDCDDEENENEMGKPISKEALKKANSELIKSKRVREDNDGKITNVVISNGFMKIDQSKIGKIEIPVDWKEEDEPSKPHDENAISDLRKKLQNCKSLVGLEIFSN